MASVLSKPRRRPKLILGLASNGMRMTPGFVVPLKKLLQAADRLARRKS
ncbi:MAG: hypothetical protein L0Y71_25065 [Gemmataceae bacterium]|nr:hypothetical protein [Gemmataceae bacterium]